MTTISTKRIAFAVTILLFIVGAPKAQTLSDGPIKRDKLLAALKSMQSRKTKRQDAAWYVKRISESKVTFHLAGNDERNIRLAGRYLGKKGLVDLIAAVSKNYLAPGDKTMADEKPKQPPSVSQTMTNSPGGMQAGRDINVNTERRLSTAAANIIAQALRAHPCPVTVGVLGTGGEPDRFANDILQIVRQPNVEAQGVFHGVGFDSFTGIQIRFSPINTPTEVVQAIRRAFEQAGIAAASGPDPNQRAGSVYIFVGYQPN